MVLSASEMQARLDKLSTNMGRLDTIVNGSETATVVTDAGTVPSVQKLLYDTGPVLQAKHVRFTLSKLNAVSGPSANDIGMVIGDASNVNGTYEYSGSAWVRKGDLPVDRAVYEALVAQAAADEALGHKDSALATEARINASTAMITNYRGAWATATAYVVRDLVLQSGLVYICTVAHTSGTFATDLAAHKWAIYQGATTADLADKTDDALGAGLVGYKGSTLNSQISLDHRRLRRTFARRFAAASAVTPLRLLTIGDSLAPMKWQHLLPQIDRWMGGVYNYSDINTGNNTAGAGASSYGGDCDRSTSSGVTGLTSAYALWPTGQVAEFADGGTALYVAGGVSPNFSKVTVFYLKESGAGTLSLSVGGSVVATANANYATFALAKLEYTQSQATASVNLSASGGVVHVISVHVSRTDNSGADTYGGFSVGGLLLSTALANANARKGWQDMLALINPDLIFFEIDDDFGDASTNDAAWEQLVAILNAACPRADKIIIGSTPRAVNDNLKLRSSNYLRGKVGSYDPSWLFFDSYYLLGSYADQIAIFGSDDGTHPTGAAEAFAASALLDFMALNTLLGSMPRATNDTSRPSRLGNGTFFGPRRKLGNGSIQEAPYYTIDGNNFQGFWNSDQSFGIRKTDGVTCKFQISYADSYPTILPLNANFDDATGQRKRSLQTPFGVGANYFIRYEDSGELRGRANLDIGFLRVGQYTRAELLAIYANTAKGTIAYCTDATGGACLAYAKGEYTTDWVSLRTGAAI